LGTLTIKNKIMVYKKLYSGIEVNLNEYIKEYMDLNNEVEILIGCDSQNQGEHTTYAFLFISALSVPFSLLSSSASSSEKSVNFPPQSFSNFLSVLRVSAPFSGASIIPITAPIATPASKATPILDTLFMIVFFLTHYTNFHQVLLLRYVIILINTECYDEIRE